MEKYKKDIVYAFADYYNRNNHTELTMDELFANYLKFKDEPREVKGVRTRKDGALLKDIVRVVCLTLDIERGSVQTKSKEGLIPTARQMISYMGIRCGYKPPEIARIMKWDRSSVYHQIKICKVYLKTEPQYRYNVNSILKQFGKTSVIL